jgi:hypothetical protein
VVTQMQCRPAGELLRSCLPSLGYTQKTNHEGVEGFIAPKLTVALPHLGGRSTATDAQTTKSDALSGRLATQARRFYNFFN